MKRRLHTYYLAASVSLITFLVYISCLPHEFVNWDDGRYIFENPHIRSLDMTFFKWAFFDFYEANWHPLTWISHALDYAVWGLNPLGHHLTNNVLHAANTFLVVLLVARLIEVGRRSTEGDSPAGRLKNTQFTIHYSPFTLIAAATTGLLFGLHPLHVESVAWVAERKDLLCALFFLLSILAYVAHRAERIAQSAKSKEQSEESTGSTPCAMRYALCFFILALLSKPMAVTLPAVLLVLDWYPFNRIQSVKSFWSACIGKIPFFALSIISSILTILAQRASGTMGDVPPLLSIRILGAAKALIAYLYNMIVPLNLVPFYPYSMDISHYVSAEYGIAIALVLGITITSAIIARKMKLWLATWSYYVIVLLPVLGIIQVGIQSRADRYTYLPSLGPFLIAGLGAAWVAAKVLTATKGSAISRLCAAGAAVVAVVFMSYLTFKQIGIWENGITLWSYVIEKEPQEVPIAYLNRGTLFGKAGQLDSAIADFSRAIELNPVSLGVFLDPSYHALAYANRGYAYQLLGQYDKALNDFTMAIALGQAQARAYAYNNRGNLYLQTGRNELALSDLQNACALGDNNGCIALQSLRN